MIKGVIFDMDGVLVDNMAVHDQVWKLFSEKYPLRSDAPSTESLAGLGNDQIIPLIVEPEVVEKYGVEYLGEAKEALYREFYAPNVKPMPGLVDFLHRLREAGIKRAVGSSGDRKNVDFVLEKCNITHLFDAIVSGDMVARRKPAPDVFLLAAEKLELEPSECIVVEDSLAGIEAAHTAGMGVIALTTTFPAEVVAKSKPTLIVKDFTQLDR